MGLDVAMGILLALKDKTLNSSICRVGMLRKAGMGLLVALGYVIEPYAHGVPSGTLTTLGFIIPEGISVLEHAVRLGIPVPKILADTLSKLRGERANPLKVEVVTKFEK